VAPARGNLLRACLAAAAVSAGWVALNAEKPVHVDDTFFLYWARTISPLPGESPIADINWDRFEESFASQTQHYMPGWAVLLSGARHLLGERESLLHWLQWPFATMFLAGAFLVARTLGIPPWGTFLLCAVNPVFLLPTASLMADMPAMGLGMLGLALWYAVPGFAGRAAAGLLLALGAQMKQSVLVLYPLLLLRPEGGITRRPQDWVFAVISLGLAGYYPDVPPHDPERRSIAGHIAWIVQSTWSPVLFRAKASYLLATAGALLLTPLACAFALAARRDQPGPGARAKAVLAGIVCIPVLARLGFWKKCLAPGVNLAGVPGTANDLWFYAAIALFLAWAWFALRPGKAAVSPVLRWWLLLAAAGFMAGARFPAVRSLIPALPPICMVFVADLGGLAPRTARIGLALAVAMSLWLGASLARNDYAFAECSRLAAGHGAGVAEARRLPLMTTGSWGLRYYVEKSGGRLLGSPTDPVAGGAVFLCPTLSDRRVIPAALKRRARRLETFSCLSSPQWPPFLPVRTIPPARTVSAFHGGHVWFPYGFSRTTMEEVEILEVRPLNRAGRRPAR